ncbi:Cif family virulence factor [Zeaxanthinibacter enoshimensis]|uniref:Ketosteroid isomerase-like protein n=1 Tax=Zeaxanthinibacter enoshimensis TaxID=392009 RepID=A0A4R6TME7_9FLAO|nr:hypothetical protein [Zeaxanthinibacter enoshimensis]TDQ32210.1 hypothetical protein CLV82_0033 [Zeaxanthinibacter enoshimensis]
MNIRVTALCFICLSFSISLNGQEEGNHTGHTATDPGTDKLSAHLDKWMNAINTDNTTAIEEAYLNNAVKIIAHNNIINGAPGIAEYYSSNHPKISRVHSLFKIEANSQKGIHYEIVSYRTEDMEEYTQLLIRRGEGEEARREFEYTGKAGVGSVRVDTAVISARRNEWVKLCNAHKAENLVQNVYSENTMYYNHKPLVIGKSDLAREYAYMNNENYTLDLHPLKVEVVNAGLVFEIGQCSGSYNGKYMLVWKKDSDGTWNVYIDSNI